MKPARFTYHAPTTLDEALTRLVELGDDAKLIAGGQSLVPTMNMRLAQPEHLIDLNGIGELTGVTVEEKTLVLGAMTRHARIETDPVIARHLPLLAAVAPSIGHDAIRHRGTIGGSLVHGEPAAQWPMVLRLLDGEVELAGPSGRRRVSAVDFQQSVFTTDVGEDEILTRVFLPLPDADEGWGYRFFCRRAGDFAVVLVGVRLAVRAGTLSHLALALGGVDTVPLRLQRLEAAAIGEVPDRQWAADMAARAADLVEPQDDIHADAGFRADLVRHLTAAALTDALADALANQGEAGS